MIFRVPLLRVCSVREFCRHRILIIIFQLCYCKYVSPVFFSDSSLFRKFKEMKVYFFENLESKESSLLQNFALPLKYRFERHEISLTFRRKFTRTINKICQNSLSLLLHSAVNKDVGYESNLHLMRLTTSM